MGKKCIRIIALFLIVCLGSLCGCVSMQKPDRTENRKGASEGGKSLSDIPENASDYIVVGFSQVGSESDWRNASTESFRKMFTAANGYYLLYEDAQQKQENQLKDVRNFILQEVDYIILDPIVETGWETVLKEAKDAGIPVILVDRKIEVADEDLYTCWVGSNFEEEGRRAGEWLENYLKLQKRKDKKLRIVTLQGTPESSAQIGRTAGFAKVLEKNKNWTMLERRNGEFTQAKGKEVMEDFLAEYEDIDVVVSENDNMTFGAIEAIEAAGKRCGPSGDIIVISFDAVQAALELMQRGKINADFECNPMLGPIVSDLIQRLERGEEVKKTQYVDEQYFEASMNLGDILRKRVY
ncbi:MAG: ABC transporter substrate-binding protein [Eubacterium sp.]|nr:ABC transporter substrate-binding protein [Eubacterium sp.]